MLRRTMSESFGLLWVPCLGLPSADVASATHLFCRHGQPGPLSTLAGRLLRSATSYSGAQPSAYSAVHSIAIAVCDLSQTCDPCRRPAAGDLHAAGVYRRYV